MNTRLRFAALMGTLAIGLAACGGGGGGSSTIPGGGGGTMHAPLSAGFSGIGRGGASAGRHTLGLTSSVVPIADFLVPDSYMTSVPLSFASAVAVAFYDPSKGTVPATLPTIAWTQSGIPVTLSTPPSAITLPGMTVAGDTQLAAPTTVGQVTLVGTPSNGDPAVTLTANAYGGTGVSTVTGGRNGMKQCLSFATGSQGIPGTTGDICIALDASGNPQVAAAHGAVLVSKPIDAVSASDATGLASTPATITGAAYTNMVSTSGIEPTIILYTASGALVGWTPVSRQIGQLGAEWYGYYRVGL